MKKETRGMTAVLLVYSLLMLSMMGVTVFILSKRQAPTSSDEPSIETQEKYVYVYVDQNEDITSTVPSDDAWIVKEYENRIGIFSANGKLLEVLEIHTKTLPKADQSLLREGITVTNRSELDALLEDYSE